MPDNNENDFYFSSSEDSSKPNENQQEYHNIYEKTDSSSETVKNVELSSEDNSDNFYKNTKIPNDVQRNNKKGMAIASLILGIFGLVCCCCAYLVFPLIVAIVGLILGIVSYKENHSGIALAGIITSSVAICFGLVVMIAVFAGGTTLSSFWDTFWEEFERAYESEMRELTSQSEQLLESVTESLPEVFSENPFSEGFVTTLRL